MEIDSLVNLIEAAPKAKIQKIKSKNKKKNKISENQKVYIEDLVNSNVFNLDT